MSEDSFEDISGEEEYNDEDNVDASEEKGDEDYYD